jgi:hypothetical protein
VALSVTLFLIAWVSVSAEEISDNVVRNGMRSCPVGELATGVDVGNNRLLCDNSFGSYTTDQEIVDSNTQTWNMSDGDVC